MKFYIFSAMLLAILTTGCSFFESSTQLVAINVTPRDATVIANGLAYTGSPMFIEAKRSKELMLLIYKPGYESQSYVVGNHLSTTGILDACGSIFIVPLFALATNGAWAMDETNLRFVLKAMPPASESFHFTPTEESADDSQENQADENTTAASDPNSAAQESAAIAPVAEENSEEVAASDPNSAAQESAAVAPVAEENSEEVAASDLNLAAPESAAVAPVAEENN